MFVNTVNFSRNSVVNLLAVSLTLGDSIEAGTFYHKCNTLTPRVVQLKARLVKRSKGKCFYLQALEW